MCLNLLGCFQLCHPKYISWQQPQCTALRGLHRAQSAEWRPQGFHSAKHNISLCVQLTDHRCRQRQDGTAVSPPKLSGSGPRKPVQPSDTCGGLWMSLWWDWGTGMVMNTQSFISHPWHCSHSDTDTHWDSKPQLPQVADLHTTLSTNATQLHLGL